MLILRLRRMVKEDTPPLALRLLAFSRRWLKNASFCSRRLCGLLRWRKSGHSVTAVKMSLMSENPRDRAGRSCRTIALISRLGVLSGDTGGIARGDVDLLPLGVVALFVHRIIDGDELVDVDLAIGAVDGDLRAPIKMQDLGVALGKRPLEAVDQGRAGRCASPLAPSARPSYRMPFTSPSFLGLKSNTGFKTHFFTSS